MKISIFLILCLATLAFGTGPNEECLKDAKMLLCVANYNSNINFCFSAYTATFDPITLYICLDDKTDKKGKQSCDEIRRLCDGFVYALIFDPSWPKVSQIIKNLPLRFKCFMFRNLHL